jgi:hypothetical protein
MNHQNFKNADVTFLCWNQYQIYKLVTEQQSHPHLVFGIHPLFEKENLILL